MTLFNFKRPAEHKETLLVIGNVHYIAVNPDAFAHGSVDHIKTVAESVDYQSHMAHIA